MAGPRDPIQRAASGDRDLYDVVDWEPRGPLDRAAVRVYSALVTTGRSAVVLLAVLIVGAQFLLVGAAALDRPVLAAYILFSVVPALGLAAFVWRWDVTRREPLALLVVTFLLGFLFAGLAAVVNTLFKTAFYSAGAVGVVLFFYVIVGPVEETVKWLAVRLFAFRHAEFDAVVDGAVYGAVAGLGFATIENSIYITQHVLDAVSASGTGSVSGAATQIAAVRSFAGPGHVIYSAFAGYYLGLAKFNRENAAPIAVKGLLVAALIHGTYNVSVTFLPTALDALGVLSGVTAGAAFIGFVLVYDGVFGYLLYRKLARYRRVYQEVGADRKRDREVSGVDRTEFDAPAADGPGDGEGAGTADGEIAGAPDDADA